MYSCPTSCWRICLIEPPNWDITVLNCPLQGATPKGKCQQRLAALRVIYWYFKCYFALASGHTTVNRWVVICYAKTVFLLTRKSSFRCGSPKLPDTGHSWWSALAAILPVTMLVAHANVHKGPSGSAKYPANHASRSVNLAPECSWKCARHTTR